MPTAASCALLQHPPPIPRCEHVNITPSRFLRVLVALLVIATCCSAQGIDAPWFDGDAINEALPLGDLSGSGSSSSSSSSSSSGADIEADAASQLDGEYDAMMTWARARSRELQQQHDQHSSSPPPQPSTSSTEDLLSVLSSHPGSFTSPEDIRNLFHSDAARAENQALEGDYKTAHHTCQNLLRVKPDFALCHRIMGSILWRQQGRWASALRLLVR